MDEQLYAALASRASALVEAGDRPAAIDILEQLVASDLPDFDRAMMCMNIAIVQDQLGDTGKALETYAAAVDLERQTESCFIAESRAAYCAKLGLYDESSRYYDELLRHPNLTPDARDRLLQNIATLEGLRS